ncbi:MAG: hypothetical protein K2Y18_04935 [Alphaproteobacteria bacterium]|jgi:hypothetical protein|nr:hypothetical protein [Alphaproteobacteria bacterium]
MARNLMVKRYKNALALALILGSSIFASSSVLADNAPSNLSINPFQCRTDLEEFSLRLRKCSKERPDQEYYANLYQDIQEFLKSLDRHPQNASHIDKCKSLLSAIHAIVGNHDTDLAPMPVYVKPYPGRLSPGLETTASNRPLLVRNKSIHYVYVSKDQKGQKKTDSEEEAAEEMTEFQLASTTASRSLRTRKKENKELE